MDRTPRALGRRPQEGAWHQLGFHRQGETTGTGAAERASNGTQGKGARRFFIATGALLLAPVVLGGCGRQSEPEPPSAAPLVLAELQQASPGPWRRGDQVLPASLEHAAEPPHAPTWLDDGELQRLRTQMQTPAGLSDAVEEAAEVPFDVPPADMPELRFVPSEEAGQTRSSEARDSSLSSLLPAVIEPANVADGAAESGMQPRMLESMLPPMTAGSERLPSTIATLPELAGPVPWGGVVVPSPQMNAVLEQCEQRLRHGFRLAERGATYLARDEFLAVLELIARAHDTERNTQFHTRALAGGLAALEESRDFVRQRPVGKPLDMPRLISGHRTPVLKSADLENLTPLLAARAYYTYAQEQLAGAAAGEPRSSIALFGLGKMAAVHAEASPAERMEAMARSMVWHQSAMLADRGNYRAANELGVLLARSGELVHARNLLVHSVRLAPHPSTYRNLAVVHEKLGETQYAQQAMNQSLAMERAGHRRGGPAVQWVDSAAFASSAPASDTTLPPVATAPPGGEAQPAKDVPSTARKGGWFPFR